jgi:tRNA-uridine 2-sulfurtransferase
MSPTPPKPGSVLVAMSGGVDSSVAAAMLKAEGRTVIGAFMRNGVKAGESAKSHRQGCCGIDDAFDARRAADMVDVPFYAVDLEDDFDALIDEFVSEYRAARTPNPCVECNRRFKFGRLLKLARDLGVESVATGHYVRLKTRGARYAVARGRDPVKDQSYVLYPLGQEALRAAVFPLSEMTKDETRAAARKFGLKVAEKPESMEICFVPTGDYRDVLRERAPEAFAKGPIETLDGVVVGEHDGVVGFTIGQRRGLSGGRKEPAYVVALAPERNAVIVGGREALDATSIVLTDVVYSGATHDESPSFTGFAQIRSRHDPAAARGFPTGPSTARVVFDAPVSAATPGQSAVFYDRDGVVLFGGRIASKGLDV